MQFHGNMGVSLSDLQRPPEAGIQVFYEGLSIVIVSLPDRIPADRTTGQEGLTEHVRNS